MDRCDRCGDGIEVWIRDEEGAFVCPHCGWERQLAAAWAKSPGRDLIANAPLAFYASSFEYEGVRYSFDQVVGVSITRRGTRKRRSADYRPPRSVTLTIALESGDEISLTARETRRNHGFEHSKSVSDLDQAYEILYEEVQGEDRREKQTRMRREAIENDPNISIGVDALATQWEQVTRHIGSQFAEDDPPIEASAAVIASQIAHLVWHQGKHPALDSDWEEAKAQYKQVVDDDPALQRYVVMLKAQDEIRRDKAVDLTYIAAATDEQGWEDLGRRLSSDPAYARYVEGHWSAHGKFLSELNEYTRRVKAREERYRTVVCSVIHKQYGDYDPLDYRLVSNDSDWELTTGKVLHCQPALRDSWRFEYDTVFRDPSGTRVRCFHESRTSIGSRGSRLPIYYLRNDPVYYVIGVNRSSGFHCSEPEELPLAHD